MLIVSGTSRRVALRHDEATPLCGKWEAPINETQERSDLVQPQSN
jgi:hypothetical protein